MHFYLLILCVYDSERASKRGKEREGDGETLISTLLSFLLLYYILQTSWPLSFWPTPLCLPQPCCTSTEITYLHHCTWLLTRFWRSNLGYQACSSKCFYLCYLPTYSVLFLTFVLSYFVCVPCACSAHRGQKRVNNSLETELQMVVSSMQELRTKLQTLWKSSHLSSFLFSAFLQHTTG